MQDNYNYIWELICADLRDEITPAQRLQLEAYYKQQQGQGLPNQPRLVSIDERDDYEIR